MTFAGTAGRPRCPATDGAYRHPFLLLSVGALHEIDRFAATSTAVNHTGAALMVDHSRSTIADAAVSLALGGMGLGSPIENQMAEALIYVFHPNQNQHFSWSWPILDGRSFCAGHILKFRENRVVIISQSPVLDWRVDFLVAAWSRRAWVRIVIECDGHDFHERTKDQAKRDRSRDRAMQRQGYVVYRFTGSEIFQDAWRCASEVKGDILSRMGAPGEALDG